ncbi:hypothetical protein IGI04_039925 [Brassica rapa subsp. trilocularis]|uniref:Uncharacterized protein n=1 Tax=Brassica rapa subsp. trilocularis TaxID=1813537 RepID=A0ABQ7KPX8_BRACM|nr:hypothetical protein IGI04_039925 [Brassica rapa subsp. trilocularis]
MYKSKASHLDVPEHLKPPICIEEAAGFHKRVKRIHDPMKILVRFSIYEVEFPIPPDKSVYQGSYTVIFDEPLHELRRPRPIGTINTTSVLLETPLEILELLRCKTAQIDQKFSNGWRLSHAFQFDRVEVNQDTESKVMIVLLKSGLSDARREDVEKEEVSNDTQERRSTLLQIRKPTIFFNSFKNCFHLSYLSRALVSRVELIGCSDLVQIRCLKSVCGRDFDDGGARE